MTAKKINLDDWYTTEQARVRLSANSSREIHSSYPRTLARYGRIRSLEISKRARLYSKEDVDAYVVDSQRGPKPKAGRERKQAEKQPCEHCGRGSDDLTECEDCGKLCCELCISVEYLNAWNSDTAFMQCATCAEARRVSCSA